jgi:8-oxo-dGTP pyrophosphatase MutT (NUDIX family)
VNSPENIWRPHVTVAAVCARDNQFLLVRERIDGRDVLNQPAGHLDPGESLQQAVIRETREETGFQFQPQKLVGIYRYSPSLESDKTYLRFAFSGQIGLQVSQQLDKEILGVEWLTLEQLQQQQQHHRSPMVLQCVLDYLHQPSYPLQIFSSDFL